MVHSQFKVLINLVGTSVASCRVHAMGESPLQGVCWSWMGRWRLIWVMWVMLAPSFMAAAHEIGTALWEEQSFQLQHHHSCKQSVINPSKGIVPLCPAHRCTEKILSYLQMCCFLEAPFPLHFNWISTTIWMVLERWSVAYCAEKTCWCRWRPCVFLCLATIKWFSQSQSSSDLHGMCLLQIHVRLNGDWLNITMASLGSVFASAGCCPTKFNSLKKPPPSGCILGVAIGVRMSHSVSR